MPSINKVNIVNIRYIANNKLYTACITDQNQLIIFKGNKKYTYDFPPTIDYIFEFEQYLSLLFKYGKIAVLDTESEDIVYLQDGISEPIKMARRYNNSLFILFGNNHIYKAEMDNMNLTLVSKFTKNVNIVSISYYHDLFVAFDDGSIYKWDKEYMFSHYCKIKDIIVYKNYLISFSVDGVFSRYNLSESTIEFIYFSNLEFDSFLTDNLFYSKSGIWELKYGNDKEEPQLIQKQEFIGDIKFIKKDEDCMIIVTDNYFDMIPITQLNV
ncbi:hypothetical protein TCON_1512 [Astathelohania contejeani]|uniref:Uncharacterized protein n=1 Tax=Astathelohania contejeani TaxID=164912 RepID=A0ABQ7HYR3_9MICR|nr:hypothetical protein TCON_1512 [Thelohania contejeani]